MGPDRSPLGAELVGMQTRMPPVRVDSFGAGDEAGFGAVRVRVLGLTRLPINAGPFGMRTRG
jgi:hypothetical protein